MGRYVSLAIDPVVNFGVRDVKPGFGSGAFRFYGSSGTFLVPNGATEVRVTALGGGGCGGSVSGCKNWCSPGGGGGGGYVVATVSVTPGLTCNIAVGSNTGGTSCFGTAVYAYGGSNVSGGTIAGGAGGSYLVSSGTTIVGRNGNAGCSGVDFSGSYTSNCADFSACISQPRGGASGSPIGGSGTGPFPGTSGADVYLCKGFNGEDTDESALASKFSNTIRWPGETIISTSRTAKSISGTAAGFPANCYAVTAYGGAFACKCNCITCQTCMNAGCGGGGAGLQSQGSCNCYCNYNYGVTCCLTSCNPGCRGDAGAGFVVIEF